MIFFGIENIVLVALFLALWDSMESDNVQSAPCSPVSLSSSDSDEDNGDASASASPLPSAESLTSATKDHIYCHFWNPANSVITLLFI